MIDFPGNPEPPAVRQAHDDTHLGRSGSTNSATNPPNLISLQPGLTANEFATIEARFRFKFPPDLKAALGFALPLAVGLISLTRNLAQKSPRCCAARLERVVVVVLVG